MIPTHIELGSMYQPRWERDSLEASNMHLKYGTARTVKCLSYLELLDCHVTEKIESLDLDASQSTLQDINATSVRLYSTSANDINSVSVEVRNSQRNRIHKIKTGSCSIENIKSVDEIDSSGNVTLKKVSSVKKVVCRGSLNMSESTVEEIVFHITADNQKMTLTHCKVARLVICNLSHYPLNILAREAQIDHYLL